MRDELERDVGADAGAELARDMGGIGRLVDRAAAGVEQELAGAVERHRVGAHLRIDDPILPAASTDDAVIKSGRAQMGRDRRAAAIDLLFRHLAAVADGEAAADHALAAVAADEIGACQRLAPPRSDMLDLGGDLVAVIDKAAALPAIAQLDRGQRPQVGVKMAFDIHLVAAEQRLGLLIGDRGGAHARHLRGLRRLHQPRQLPTGKGGEIADVGGVIVQHAEAADRRGDAEPAVMLHGPRVLGAALGVKARVRAGVHHHRAHAQRLEVHRQHHPHRPTADDDDGRGKPARLCHVRTPIASRLRA
jgi:hypothetical protein